MRIVLCGSMFFIDMINACARDLKELGHDVIYPRGSQKEGLSEKLAGNFIHKYYVKISESDAILVMNFQKKFIYGYIGPNTLMEIAFAHILKKPVYVFSDITKDLYCYDEVMAMNPIFINRDLAILTEQDRELFKNKNAEFKDLPSSEIAKQRYMIDNAYTQSLKTLRDAQNDMSTLSARRRALQGRCEKLSHDFRDDKSMCAKCGFSNDF